MRNRIIGGVLVLCATVCFVCWGQDRTQTPKKNQPPATEETGETGSKTNEPRTAAAPKSRREVRKPPAPHLTAAEDAASERAIRAQSAALIAEYNAKHADAFVERFLPNAEYELDTGEVITGRPAIQAHFEQSFEKFPNARAQAKGSKIRLISLHMAIEEGTNSITHSADDAESKSDFVAIWAFNDGHWLLASVRDLPMEDVADTAQEHLEPLAWLVGDWVDESPNALVKTSCRWSEDQNYLLQDFTVKVQGSDVMSGTQRIGWDPLSRIVRAWLFDSHGGFGESFWNWDGERWVIRSSAVRADGTIVASLNYLIPQDNDAYRWEASHRMSGDEPLPDVTVLIVRQAPLPGTTIFDESTE